MGIGMLIEGIAIGIGFIRIRFIRMAICNTGDVELIGKLILI
jgi:hypothetical protein